VGTTVDAPLLFTNFTLQSSCYPFNEADIISLDFVVIRFLMKLFKSANVKNIFTSANEFMFSSAFVCVLACRITHKLRHQFSQKSAESWRIGRETSIRF